MKQKLPARKQGVPRQTGTWSHREEPLPWGWRHQVLALVGGAAARGGVLQDQQAPMQPQRGLRMLLLEGQQPVARQQQELRQRSGHE